MQDCTATSTTKDEYVVASNAAKDTLWLGRMVRTFRQVDSDSTLVVYIDNQGVISLSKNMVHHNASKHIDVGYHFVRSCVISRNLGIEKKSV